MAKPTTLPEWDTNSTNATEPPAGYKSDGWSNGETVKSSYFNWAMNLTYQWLAWLSRAVDKKVPAMAGEAEGGAFAEGIWVSSANNEALFVPLPVHEGERITSIRINILGDSVQTVECQLFKLDNGSASGPPISDAATSAASFTQQVLTINTASSSPLAVDVSGDDAVYYVRCRTSGSPSDSGIKIGGVVVTTEPV